MLIFFFFSATSVIMFVFFFSSRRRHTRFKCDWSLDVCSSDLDAKRWKPKIISMATAEGAEQLRKKLKVAGLEKIEVSEGTAGTVKVATHPEVDFVVSAIVGVAGLEATYEAVKAGKSIGLANKEC